MYYVCSQFDGAARPNYQIVKADDDAMAAIAIACGVEREAAGEAAGGCWYGPATYDECAAWIDGEQP